MTYRAVLDACNPVTIVEIFACKCGRMFKRHIDLTIHHQYNYNHHYYRVDQGRGLNPVVDT